MHTLIDNRNKHKVAFYAVLVILLVTFGQCHSTEVISHSSQDMPKIINTDVGYGASKSIFERLKEVRETLRSLIFDWNLGESGLDEGM